MNPYNDSQSETLDEVKIIMNSVNSLQDRIKELNLQIKEKNQKINKLEEEGETTHDQNISLHQKIVFLQSELNSSYKILFSAIRKETPKEFFKAYHDVFKKNEQMDAKMEEIIEKTTKNILEKYK